MTKEKREFVLFFLLVPFVVSGLWWVSTWLGIPALVIGLPLWVGSLMKLAEWPNG
jgi:hypothetical protein